MIHFYSLIFQMIFLILCNSWYANNTKRELKATICIGHGYIHRVSQFRHKHYATKGGVYSLYLVK